MTSVLSDCAALILQKNSKHFRKTVQLFVGMSSVGTLKALESRFYHVFRHIYSVYLFCVFSCDVFVGRNDVRVLFIATYRTILTVPQHSAAQSLTGKTLYFLPVHKFT